MKICVCFIIVRVYCFTVCNWFTYVFADHNYFEYPLGKIPSVCPLLSVSSTMGIVLILSAPPPPPPPLAVRYIALILMALPWRCGTTDTKIDVPSD